MYMPANPAPTTIASCRGIEKIHHSYFESLKRPGILVDFEASNTFEVNSPLADFLTFDLDSGGFPIPGVRGHACVLQKMFLHLGSGRFG